VSLLNYLLGKSNRRCPLRKMTSGFFPQHFKNSFWGLGKKNKLLKKKSFITIRTWDCCLLKTLEGKHVSYYTESQAHGLDSF
jgi:hypothetical protein